MGRLAIGIATDICRYRSGGARLHYRLTGVIRRFGDYAAKCSVSVLSTAVTGVYLANHDARARSTRLESER